MIFFLETIFLSSYFILKVYYFFDSKVLLSDYGGKLNKYINKKETKINYNILNIKLIFKFLLISISLTLLKISFDYSLLQSNFIPIKLFNKNIDIVTMLANNMICFKIIHYLLFAIFIYNITFKIFTFLKNSKKTLSVIPNDSLILQKNELIYIDYNYLFQNILITGSIGSGKTSGPMSKICNELIFKNFSGLIIDIKGNYIETIKQMAKNCNRLDDIVEISMNSKFNYNPLDKPDINATELALMIKQVLTLLSPNNISDSFWLDKVESYLKYFINIIRAYDGTVSFKEIHNLVIDKKYLIDKIEKIKLNFINNKYTDEQLFCVKDSIKNIKEEYLKLDDRTFNIINAEITRITNVFVGDYNILKKFNSKSSNFKINSNKIYVLSMNIAKYKKLLKVIATYIKLDFQNQILSSNLNKSPKFFICDEYAEFANEEDATFFSLSREFNCINVISIQSYSSLINTFKNENVARVIIQNLVNKIWLRNDDNYTIQEIIKQIGKEEKRIESFSYNESSKTSRYNIILKKFKNFNSNLSKGYSYNKITKYKYSEEDISQKLKTHEAIAILGMGGKITFNSKIKFDIWRC